MVEGATPFTRPCLRTTKPLMGSKQMTLTLLGLNINRAKL